VDGTSQPGGEAQRWTLIAALGDEPLAPLVLARQIRAERVICVGRPVVQWRVPALLSLLQRDGCSASWLPLNAVDVPGGLGVLEGRLRELGERSVMFDLTNAHGVVGFALYELARRRERALPGASRLVRVDWSDRRMRSISPDRAEDQPLEVRLPLADFLSLHGKRLLGVERSHGSAGRFGRAAHRLAQALEAAEPLLEAVHHSAWNHPLKVTRRHQPATRALIDALIGDGLLRAANGALYTVDLVAFQYLHGRWLEEYLFEIAMASGRFDDCASGLRFGWEGSYADGDGGADVANEIDFASTANGRATVASCKTGFRDAAAPLYELLTLAERAAGRSVVTVFATSERLDRADRHRAAALGVRVLDAARLADEARVLAALLGEDR
jgi:hypothetical protein